MNIVVGVLQRILLLPCILTVSSLIIVMIGFFSNYNYVHMSHVRDMARDDTLEEQVYLLIHLKQCILADTNK